jgi:glycosyltransferase involved in cell wall biosynthesis
MGLRLAFVGTMFPEYDFTGGVTTALALGLAGLDSVDHVTVFAQLGARLPDYYTGPARKKVTVRHAWALEEPSTLLRAAGLILRARGEFDAVVFNTYVTAYGKNPLSNAIGLLLPSVVARLSRRPVFAYMHNFVETQDIERLGYSPSRAVRGGVRRLEHMMLRDAQVVVPLESQAELISRSFGIRPPSFFFPYIESYLLAKSLSVEAMATTSHRRDGRRVLLMGAWGPQKDLEGALQALECVARKGSALEILIVGAPSRQFPAFSVEEVQARHPSLAGHLRYAGMLEDQALFQSVLEHDLLILPYNATGGYSGVMNFAAITGIQIVAYDLPQLREQAERLHADVRFVEPNHLAECLGLLFNEATRAPVDPGGIGAHLQATEAALELFAHTVQISVLEAEGSSS